jgi:hypothetical protein
MFPAIFTSIRVGKIRTVFWKAYLACTTSEATCQWCPQTSTETATGGARTVVGLRPPAVRAPPAPLRDNIREICRGDVTA